MGISEMALIAGLIARTLRNRDDESELRAVRDEVATLCSKFRAVSRDGLIGEPRGLAALTRAR